MIELAQQQACVPVEVLDRAVMEAFQQAPSTEMVQRNGVILRIYADMEKKTWTLFVIQPQKPGEACLVAGGGSYTRYPASIGRAS
jgi:hypothetical protein